MGQERLENLTIISTESEFLKDLNNENLINEFVKGIFPYNPDATPEVALPQVFYQKLRTLIPLPLMYARKHHLLLLAVHITPLNKKVYQNIENIKRPKTTKKKKPRTETSSSDSDSGPINLRQKTPPPTASYSKSSSQQNCLPQYQKTQIHMKKKSKTQTSSSESSGSGSYTSESEDSDEEVELAINPFHKKKGNFPCEF
uniref:Uncharacterized protein LOC114337059 n=1 Tax=Diabrotica virgifera virgifera TaxID=50390 RepID=A0A6P7G8L8_DIAVI